LLFLASVVLTASAPQRELEKDTSAILQASYIYNIAKLVEWKDPAMSSGTFIIGVIGGANLYQEMIKKYSTKAIGKQPIEVRKLPRSATVDRCHILFVGQSDIALMPEIYRNLVRQEHADHHRIPRRPGGWLRGELRAHRQHAEV
jgi:hypothetical protein